MKRLCILFVLTCLLLTLVNAQGIVPKDTVRVKADGTGDYTTIAEAIQQVPAFPLKRVTIWIAKGTYKEKLIIPSWKTNITLLGEDRDQTIITYDDYSGKGSINTFTSYTLWVQANDFHAENLTIENSAGPVGQAVALHADGDRCIIRNCRLLGNQDTLYAGASHVRQYYDRCYISGTTDFIFGSAVAVFNRCTIFAKKNSYITAASTPQGQAYGFVFFDTDIQSSPEVTQLYLGRPWRPYAQTVWIRCQLPASIIPEGWHNWDKPHAEKTTWYAEYQSSGPGGKTDRRVGWSHQLTRSALKLYTVDKIMGGRDRWSPER